MRLVFADRRQRPYPWSRAPSTSCHRSKGASEGRAAVVYHHNYRTTHDRQIREWMDRLPGCTHAYYWNRQSPRTFFRHKPMIPRWNAGLRNSRTAGVVTEIWCVTTASKQTLACAGPRTCKSPAASRRQQKKLLSKRFQRRFPASRVATSAPTRTDRATGVTDTTMRVGQLATSSRKRFGGVAPGCDVRPQSEQGSPTVTEGQSRTRRNVVSTQTARCKKTSDC